MENKKLQELIDINTKGTLKVIQEEKNKLRRRIYKITKEKDMWKERYEEIWEIVKKSMFAATFDKLMEKEEIEEDLNDYIAGVVKIEIDKIGKAAKSETRVIVDNKVSNTDWEGNYD